MPYIQKSNPFHGASMEFGPFGKRKKKKTMVPGGNRKRLTAKQRRNREFLAPSATAVATTFLLDKGIRQKVGQGVKNIFQKFF